MSTPVRTRINARVSRARSIAPDVVELKLEDAEGRRLPAWQPGAHIDLHLPSGLVRQYSLCGDLDAEHTYTVAVLRERDGRGGSAEVHDTLVNGSRVVVGLPRNNFELQSSPSYLFIAGGIGITPILPMVEMAAATGADWRLLYCGRSRSTMAYLDRVSQIDARRISIVAEDVSGRPDLAAATAAAPRDAQIYCCGPAGLLDAVEKHCAQTALSDGLHLERFAAAPGSTPVPALGDAPFDVHLQRSNLTVHVASDQSILAALSNAGVDALSSCEEGFCGSCEVGVLGGTPEHRDTVAPPSEHDAANTMLICVGRSRSPRLTLDL